MSSRRARPSLALAAALAAGIPSLSPPAHAQPNPTQSHAQTPPAHAPPNPTQSHAQTPPVPAAAIEPPASAATAQPSPPPLQPAAPRPTPPQPALPAARPSAPHYAQAVPLPAAVAARQSALAQDLAVLSARSEGRVLNGSLQLASGAALITLGALLDEAYARPILVLVGAGAFAHGLTTLTLVPDAAAIANTYTHMPALTAEQIRTRIRYGEESLATLARAGRRARIVDGTITMFVASSYIPLSWWLQQRADADYRFGDTGYDYAALTISGISFFSGLATALIKSEAERRLRSYRELDEELERQAPGALEQLARNTSLQLAATPGRLLLGAHLRF